MKRNGSNSSEMEKNWKKADNGWEEEEKSRTIMRIRRKRRGRLIKGIAR